MKSQIKAQICSIRNYLLYKGFIALFLISLTTVSCTEKDEVDYFIDESLDLNNNQVPAGWEFFETNAPVNLKDGRLVAAPTDAFGGLRRTSIMPSEVKAVKFEWDGNLAFSTWGMLNMLKINYSDDKDLAVYLETAGSWSSESNFLFLQYNYDSESRQELKKYSVLLRYGNFHYTAIVRDDRIEFSCREINATQDYVNQTVPISIETEFNIQTINSYEFITYTTTDSENWLDNIKVTLIR